ncbi:lipoprotein [Spiroplasma turonicum]|uniref:Lipoprotein n=1 Tax=Spiroplasma turonicum TaxID=216946 RepID=A0A0K1P597_9MOLU|nr:lipoprotein [Spiroplasma turonicum]AKU79458.1 hypothetical protein STURON_00212 [Spiroplasma turonicum]ALX70480.1 hypothetical protein STURO_v1c02110 [Spiroplasma turonicum]
MKKLIGWLTAISLVASTSSTVVACGDKDNSWDVRPDKPKLNPELAKKLIASLAGDAAVANMDFGSFFSTDDATSIVVNMINELISKQYSFDSTNKLFKDLNFTDLYQKNDDGSIEQEFKQKYSSDTRSIAEDNLFLEYTKALSSNENFDFNTQAKYLYDLNIVNDTTVSTLDDKGDPKNDSFEVKSSDYKTVSFQRTGEKTPTPWKYSGEIIEGLDENQTLKSHLPNIKDLTLEYSEDVKDENVTKFYLVKDEVKTRISSKTALYLRFQQYFESKLLEDINANLLTKSFLDANMFKTKSAGDGNNIFLNTSSPIFSKTQSWSNNTNEKLKTNVKMVWTVKYDNTKKDLKLEEVIGKKLKGVLNFATGEIINNFEKGVKDLIEALSSLDEKVVRDEPSESTAYTPITNDSNSYDPYFGQSGFKGFTLYNNGTSIGDSPISGANYESAIKEWNNGAGLVFKSPEKYSFTDKDNGNYEEIVVVLPIYMIELLGGSGVDDQNTYEVIGKNTEERKKIKLGKSINNENEFKEIWNRPINSSLHSKDVQELLKDTSKRNSIINQLKYLVSNDSASSELAKTSLYSLYLDKDLVYYAGLYNEIGKYIKNEDDKDE